LLVRKKRHSGAGFLSFALIRDRYFPFCIYTINKEPCGVGCFAGLSHVCDNRTLCPRRFTSETDESKMYIKSAWPPSRRESITKQTIHCCPLKALRILFTILQNYKVISTPSQSLDSQSHLQRQSYFKVSLFVPRFKVTF
jgi:hypothetical protein